MRAISLFQRISWVSILTLTLGLLLFAVSAHAQEPGNNDAGYQLPGVSTGEVDPIPTGGSGGTDTGYEFGGNQPSGPSTGGSGSGAVGSQGGGTAVGSQGGGTAVGSQGGGQPTGSKSLTNPLNSTSFTGPNGLLTKIIDVILIFALPIIVFFIMYAGFMYVTAAGDTGKISTAHSALTWAVIGGVIVLGAKLIMAVIQNTIKAF